MSHDGPMTEDEVFEGVRQLIVAGEYRDTRYIQIGPLPEPPRKAGNPVADFAAFRRYQKHLPARTMVDRSSPEYAAARDGGLLVPLPRLEPASPEAVAEAEDVIGYPLPRLLRRLYLEAGNGGFGPRSGILGVRGGVAGNGYDDWVELARGHRADPNPLYPLWLTGIFDWGCAIWSLIDCRDPAGSMWSWDGNTHTLRQHDQTISDWLALWFECRLEMPEGTAPPTVGEVRQRRAGRQAARPGGHLPRVVHRPGRPLSDGTGERPIRLAAMSKRVGGLDHETTRWTG